MSRRGTLALSWGPGNGGAYAIRQSGTWRICLWFIALTLTPYEIDDLMDAYADPRIPEGALSMHRRKGAK